MLQRNLVFLSQVQLVDKRLVLGSQQVLALTAHATEVILAVVGCGCGLLQGQILCSWNPSLASRLRVLGGVGMQWALGL